jgi:hypothetical protein
MWLRWFNRHLTHESDEFLKREWEIILETLTETTINFFKQAPMGTILDGAQPLFRGLGFVLMECAGMTLSKKYNNNSYFHSPSQLRKDKLIELIATAKNPLLITSHLKAINYLSSITKINLNCRIIPTDFSNSLISKENSSLVDQIDSFRTNLKNTTENVDLVLFGAGVLGKSIPLFLANPNAICVDLGSTFDLFGGVNSRYWSRVLIHFSDWKDCISL